MIIKVALINPRNQMNTVHVLSNTQFVRVSVFFVLWLVFDQVSGDVMQQ